MEKRCRPEAGHFKQLNDIQLPKVKKRRVKQVIVLPDDYIVERIVAKRQRQNSTEYLVNWAGYRPEEATWEPAAHIPDWLLEDFEKPCQERTIKSGFFKTVRRPGALYLYRWQLGQLNDQNGSVFAILFVVCTVLHADLYLFSVRQISVSSNR